MTRRRTGVHTVTSPSWEKNKKKVLHPTPGRVSCFLSDRVPRRDLTGPARPAGHAGLSDHRLAGTQAPGFALVGRRASRNAGANVLGGEIKGRSEEHTSELQSLMRSSYAVFCL